MSRLFNEEEQQFVYDNVEGKSVKELTELVNKKLSRNVTEKQMYFFKKHHHLRSYTYPIIQSLFNEEEKQYIFENVKGKFAIDFLEEFNKKFNRNITMNQLNGYKGRHKLKCCRKFSPSQKKSLGYEYKDKNGHWKIKIKEPDVYISKSRYVYEKYKGKIPNDCLVIFADGNKDNFDLDNLMLVSKTEFFVMKTHGLNFKDKDLMETSVLLAKESIKRWDAYMDYLKVTDYDKYLLKNRQRNKLRKINLED